MKKIMYIAVAAIAALSSCSSDQFAESGNEGNNGEAKVFTGTIEDDGMNTRSTLVSNIPYWESTDKVCINGAVYNVIPDGSNAARATFTKESGDEPTGTYKAFYADGANSANYWDSSTSSFKLPASYTYTEGKFNMPMYAESTSTELAFKNICGVLAIKVTSAKLATVKTITVTSDQAISGTCKIEATEGKYAATATGTATADKTVTLNCGDGVTTTAEGTVFYLPLPVGSHTLTIDVTDGIYGSIMMTASAVTIARNTIYNITLAGRDYVTMYSPDYGALPYTKWATMNLGATTVAESPETAYGDYYTWLEYDTYYSSIKHEDGATPVWKSSDKTHITGMKSGYNYQNYCNKYDESTGKYVYECWWPDEAQGDLPHDLDLINKSYGGNWCMPISVDFIALTYAAGGKQGRQTLDPTVISSSTTTLPTEKGIYWCDGTEKTTYKVPGLLFIDCRGAKVFFPAAGVCGNEADASESVTGKDKTLNGVGTMFMYATRKKSGVYPTSAANAMAYWSSSKMLNNFYFYAYAYFGCSYRGVLK